MRVFFGNDHAAYETRQPILNLLRELGHQVEDLGWDSIERSDYPDFAHAVARAVAADPRSRGLLICGSGIGMSMAANRTPGARAALVTDSYGAEMARRHNDANILVLRSRHQDLRTNLDLIRTFLETDFEGGRHQPRVEKIEKSARRP